MKQESNFLLKEKAIATKSPLLRKLKDIRYNYGDEAVEYFKNFHYCEKCGEKRLVCLCVHHVHGKQENVFETLCHNCHMALHAKRGDVTYETELDWFRYKEEQSNIKKQRDDRINQLIVLGFTNKEITRIFNI